MKQPEVVVIDYGVGNLLSVQRGLEHCGAAVTVTGDHATILAAPKVVLPGVGAFGQGMAELKKLGLDGVVRDVARKGTPLLGICLGMQMLLDESVEFGTHEGLGLIPGQVIPVPDRSTGGDAQKIPHIGWNSLVKGARGEWESTLLADNAEGDSVYFVHSFMASPARPEDRIADCIYGGHAVSAVIGRDNVSGCQFHPEKSGEGGLKVLRRFLRS